MAATFTESQQLDYLWKKIGYGVAKTAEPSALNAANEGTPSPLLYRGDLVWAQKFPVLQIIKAGLPILPTGSLHSLDPTIWYECMLDRQVQPTYEQLAHN